MRSTQNTLFIDIAMMLWAFNIERMLGTEIDVDGCIEDGLVVCVFRLPSNLSAHDLQRFPDALFRLSVMSLRVSLKSLASSSRRGRCWGWVIDYSAVNWKTIFLFHLLSSSSSTQHGE